MHIEQFKATLLELCTQLQNTWIEKEAYWDFIVNTGLSTPSDLEALKQRILVSPLYHRRFRENFADFVQTVQQLGVAAFAEDLLENLPPDEKPN
jgi:hypothetical protein